MYSRIVVGTDGTDRSLIAVDHAARLAAAFDRGVARRGRGFTAARRRTGRPRRSRR